MEMSCRGRKWTQSSPLNMRAIQHIKAQRVISSVRSAGRPPCLSYWKHVLNLSVPFCWGADLVNLLWWADPNRLPLKPTDSEKGLGSQSVCLSFQGQFLSKDVRMLLQNTSFLLLKKNICFLFIVGFVGMRLGIIHFIKRCQCRENNIFTIQRPHIVYNTDVSCRNSDYLSKYGISINIELIFNLLTDLVWINLLGEKVIKTETSRDICQI